MFRFTVLVFTVLILPFISSAQTDAKVGPGPNEDKVLPGQGASDGWSAQNLSKQTDDLVETRANRLQKNAAGGSSSSPSGPPSLRQRAAKVASQMKSGADKVLTPVGAMAAGARGYTAEAKRAAEHDRDADPNRVIGNAVWDAAGGGTVDLGMAIGEEEAREWSRGGKGAGNLVKSYGKAVARTAAEKALSPYRVSQQIVKEEIDEEVAAARREGRKPDINAAKKRAAVRLAGEMTQVNSFAEATYYDADADRQAVRTTKKLQSKLLARLEGELRYLGELQDTFNSMLQRGPKNLYARERIVGTADQYNRMVPGVKADARSVVGKDLVDESGVDYRFLTGAIAGLPERLVVPDAFRAALPDNHQQELEAMLDDFDNEADSSLEQAARKLEVRANLARAKAAKAGGYATLTADEVEAMREVFGNGGVSEFQQEREEALRQTMAAERAQMAGEAAASEREWNRVMINRLPAARSSTEHPATHSATPRTTMSKPQGGIVAGFGGPAAVHPEAGNPKYRSRTVVPSSPTSASPGSTSLGSTSASGGSGAIYSPPDYEAARRRIAERNGGLPKGALPPQAVCDANPQECE